MISFQNFIFCAAISAILLSFAALPHQSLAQDEAMLDDLFPPQATALTTNIDVSALEETHPPVRLTPDKSEIIRLKVPAKSIIVGNPVHLSILMDTTKTLVLVPREPGATHFTILDSDGKIIMQRHAIIASPKKDYVRIRRTCANSTADTCQQTSVYYCPDMCHEIAVLGGDEGSGGTESTEGAPSAGDMAGGIPAVDPTAAVTNEPEAP